MPGDAMSTLQMLGWVSGLAGAGVCAASGAVRLTGAFWIAGFQAGTLLQAGMAAMVFGCFCFLAVLVRRQ